MREFDSHYPLQFKKGKYMGTKSVKAHSRKGHNRTIKTKTGTKTVRVKHSKTVHAKRRTK